MLYRLDPRTRLWLMALIVTLCMVGKEIWFLASLVAAAHLILMVGGVSFRVIFRTWRTLTILLLFILILQPLLLQNIGEVVFRFWRIHMTDVGLLTGLRYALRLTGAAFGVLIPLSTTPIQKLIRGLQKLGLPYNWAVMIGLAVHYAGTIGALHTTLREAQQARGWDLSTGGMIKQARAAVPTLIAVIIASLRMSDSLAIGLASRGYGLGRGRHTRTTLHDISLCPSDYIVLILSTLAAGFCLILVIR